MSPSDYLTSDEVIAHIHMLVIQSLPLVIGSVGFYDISSILGGARGVVVITEGNEHGYTSSNPGRYWLHFT